jgi:quinoprotein glucose dehydrogenase
LPLLALLLFAACEASPAPDTARSIAPGDWPHYARDLAASKYSPLEQIHSGNVDDLEIVWNWESADYDLPARFPGTSVNNNYQTTPIKIGERLYTSTNMGQAAALDPATGQEVWLYDPYAAGLRATPGGRANRGVAYWADGEDERVFLGSGQYLVALDAGTGTSGPS